MKKKLKISHPKIQQIEQYIDDHLTIYEISDTEKEFGEIISDSWELIAQYPSLHKKVLLTAHKLRELKVVLQHNGKVNKTIH